MAAEFLKINTFYLYDLLNITMEIHTGFDRNIPFRSILEVTLLITPQISFYCYIFSIKSNIFKHFHHTNAALKYYWVDQKVDETIFGYFVTFFS